VFPQKDRSSSAKTSPSRWIVERGLLNEKNWSEHPKLGAANKRSQQPKASSRTGMNAGQQQFRIRIHPFCSVPHPICVTSESLA
jgi:hypothetical protein